MIDAGLPIALASDFNPGSTPSGNLQFVLSLGCVKMKMTLEEISEGVTKKIKVNKLVNADGVTYKTCSTCNGSGRIMRVAQTFLGAMQTQSTCHACQGAGKMIDHRPSDARLKMRVPSPDL